MTSTDWSVWQDAAIATKFVNDRRSGILGAREQINVMLELLPVRPENNTPIHVLDLGCGDGILLEAVLRHWSGAHGTALDGSPTMLEQAAERLAVFHPSAVTFIAADFNDPTWRNTLPTAQHQAVVSGFAIHHSEDERKLALYAEIYDLLVPGGVFVNIEHVSSDSSHGEGLFERAYAKNIVRHRRENGGEAIYEEVLQEIRTRLDKSANRLTSVETQVQWLRDIGYTDADCYWKHYELAVFAGYKPN